MQNQTKQKPPHEMSYAEFVSSVGAFGGMNRTPSQLRGLNEIQSYDVFLSGPAASQLDPSLNQQQFRDVTLQAMTEKLGLNPKALRDNVKVAEIVATRHAYMSAVLDASASHELRPEVQHEYGLLSEFLDHPVIRSQVAEQLRLSDALTPAMVAARAKLGADITERAAAGVSHGAIVAQNADFTVQDVGGGKVVAHENSRLMAVPEVGTEVTVTYYKGKGQVVAMEGREVSPIFVDPHSEDLAVTITDPQTGATEMVLFNSMLVVSEFAEVHSLPRDFVRQAMDVREQHPKAVPEKPVREPAGDVYLDPQTGSVALDYVEKGARHTAVFHSAVALAEHAQSFGANGAHIERAKVVEVLASQNLPDVAQREIRSVLPRGYVTQKVNEGAGRYSGEILATSRLHVAQDIGRNTVVLHDKRNLDKVPELGARISVGYASGRGAVDVREPGKDRSVGR